VFSFAQTKAGIQPYPVCMGDFIPYVLEGRDYVRFGSSRNNYCDFGDCVARASRV